MIKKPIKKLTEKKLTFNVSNFNKKDMFFYDVTKYLRLIFKIFDMDELKLDEEQMELLLLEIKKCSNNEGEESNKKSINILPIFYETLANIKYPDLKKTQYAININNIIKIIKENNETPNLKRISITYQKIYNKPISISTIDRVLKNNLQMKYLKTKIKIPRLNEYNYIFMSLVFIKGFIRCIQIGLNIIYIDETGFMIENNNFYYWRERNEECYGKSKTNLKKKLNLILGVTKEKVIARYFTFENVCQNHFMNFINIISSNLRDEEKKNSIILMDNAIYHKTDDAKLCFKKNNLKVMTIPPYRSPFNMIELVFRYVKNVTYKNIYKSIEEMQKDVIKILEGEELKKTLIKLYKETLLKYKDFILKNEKNDYNQIYDEIVNGNGRNEINLEENENDE